jgi:sodium-dependent dicarboxylate transporter 2/3/5
MTALHSTQADAPNSFGRTAKVGLVLGLAVFAAMFAMPPPSGLSSQGWATIALLALMVIWWVTEALPVAVTALAPLIGLPLIAGVKPVAAAAPYADPVIYLFVGGFILAAAVESVGLHRRFAFGLLRRIGTSPGALLAGLLLAAGIVSMWISNTATALMLTPIAVGVATALGKDGKPDPAIAGAFTIAIAYAASIGGVATPIGSPTNLVAMGYLDQQGLAISFTDWMLLGVPLSVAMLGVAWVVLRLGMGAAAGKSVTAAQALPEPLGPMSAAEWRVLAIFIAVALAWIFRELIIEIPGLKGLSDMQIALIGVVALFLTPSGRGGGERLMTWKRAEQIPWGVALLFGAGLSMAAAMEANGVTQWLSGELDFLGGWVPLAVLATLVALTVFLSEFASNTATLTAFLPVIGAVAAATGLEPLYLVFGACMGASLAFMMPVGTPPNAIAYATGHAPMKTMIRLGLVLNLAGIALIVAMVELLGPLVLK